jgi:hypothetical protein
MAHDDNRGSKQDAMYNSLGFAFDSYDRHTHKLISQKTS